MDRERSWVRVEILIDYRFVIALDALSIVIWLLFR